MKEKMIEKVKRALELEQEMIRLHKELTEVKEEWKDLMSDPYIYDKVYGLKQGGII